MSKAKYSNDFKSEVIAQGTIKEVLKKKKQLYFNSLVDVFDEDEGIFYKTLKDNKWNEYLLENCKDNHFDCALRLIESKRRKAKKVKDKISALVLSGQAVFLTLTFTDEVLSKTIQETRRRYVARFLKGVSGDYVANIDFSPDINREHYHAVIIKRVDLKSWSYGFAFAEKVRCRPSDLTRVSKYITKLTAHALKVDATRLIYSRL